MNAYDYILLDWDGNLAKTLDIWLESCRQPFAKRGLKLTDRQIGASFGGLKTHLEQWGIYDVDEFIDEMDKASIAMMPNAELYPDALEVLEELHKRGKKLALVTTSFHDTVKSVFDRYGLDELFDAVVTHHDTKNHKPHIEPLEYALKALDGTKDRAVMIGDSDKDLGAAQNYKIDSVLFYPPEHEKFYDLDELKKHKPTHIVDDFRKILDIV